jgi:hypothetical protein
MVDRCLTTFQMANQMVQAEVKTVPNLVLVPPEPVTLGTTVEQTVRALIT